MPQSRDKILSVSRRTDIPGQYTPWFLKGIAAGTFQVKNPYNKRIKTVTATPDTVHSIVFWSKNYQPFLNLFAHQILADKGFNLFFNFTVNSRSLLEPGIPDTGARLDQATFLADRFGPDKLAWRFDPICFYEQDGKLKNNLDEFFTIAQAMASIGVTRCVISFYDKYKKVDHRLKHLAAQGGPLIEFIDPEKKKKEEIIKKLAAQLSPLNIQLFLCCEGSLAQDIPWEGVEPNACIDGKLLKKLFGGNPETARDRGQRTKLGCNCTKSVDIGSYEEHPCFHNCLFCYAKTGADIHIKQGIK